MEKETKKKGVAGKIVTDIKDHAKTQHQITKARYDASKVSPADAKEMFNEQHKYANLSLNEKQQIQLEEIRAGNVTDNQILKKKI